MKGTLFKLCRMSFAYVFLVILSIVFSYDIIAVRLRDVVHQVASGQSNSWATFQVFKQVWQVFLRLCGGPKKTEKVRKKEIATRF